VPRLKEDESATELDADSLSMRGAQREITAWFKSHGYEPAGRREVEYSDASDGSEETYRLFGTQTPDRPADTPAADSAASSAVAAQAERE